MNKATAVPIKIQTKDGRIIGEYLTDGRVKIFKGSFFRNFEVNSLGQRAKNERLYLLNNGYIKDNQLVKDYIFENPSLAVSSLMGHMASGQQTFITIDNIELGDFLATESIDDYEAQKLATVIDKLTKEEPTKSIRRFLDEDDNIKLVTTEDIEANTKVEIEYTPKEKPTKVYGEKIMFPRNYEKAKRAIMHSGYKCEIDENHHSFINKNNIPYMEAHHLIPLSYQEYFEYSLDVEANIVSLCPNCHRNIHYGKDIRHYIEKLYIERCEKLKLSGIKITLTELFKIYDV